MITVSAIANASKGELLCITYEILLEEIKEAIESKGEERKLHLEKAVEVILTLVEDLEMEVQIAKDLFSLYVYVQGILVSYQVADHKLQEAYELIDKIYQGYVQISEKEIAKGPSIQNAQNIYAGMTYGKSDLTEMVMQSPTRGFKA